MTVTVHQRPIEATRSANKSCKWQAEAIVNGRTYTATSRMAPANDIARQLVLQEHDPGKQWQPVEISVEPLVLAHDIARGLQQTPERLRGCFLDDLELEREEEALL